MKSSATQAQNTNIQMSAPCDQINMPTIILTKTTATNGSAQQAPTIAYGNISRMMTARMIPPATVSIGGLHAQRF